MQDNQAKPRVVEESQQEGQNSSEIIDPVNTTLGVFDSIKVLFKAIFTQ